MTSLWKRAILPATFTLLMESAIAGCVHRRSSPGQACLDAWPPPGFASTVEIIAGPATTSVEGFVAVRGFGTPVAEATVSLDAPNGPTVKTSADGEFSMGQVAPGRHALVMRRIGFEPLRGSITVPVGGHLRIEAQQRALDGGCEGLGPVATGKS